MEEAYVDTIIWYYPEVSRWFEEDLESEIVSWFDVAHVHECVVRQWLHAQTSVPEVVGNFHMIWISVFLPTPWFDSGFKNIRQSRRFRTNTICL